MENRKFENQGKMSFDACSLHALSWTRSPHLSAARGKMEAQTVDVYNLRCGADGSYSPIGAPVLVAPEGWRVLCTDSRDAAVAFVTVPGQLGVMRLDGRGAVSVVDSFDGEALCAYCGSGECVVMTTGGVRRLVRTPSGWVAASVTGQALPVLFKVVAGADVAVVTSGHDLGDKVLPGDVVGRDHALSITASVAGACREAVRRAGREGRFVQAVLVRAVARDAAGNVLWRGPVTPVVPQWKLPFTGQVRLPMDGERRHVLPTELEVPAWSLAVDVLPALNQADAESVAFLDIEVSPGLHPLESSDGAGQVNVVRTPEGQAMSVVMPAAHKALSAQWGDASRRSLLKAYRLFDSTCRVAARINCPFTYGLQTVVGNPWEADVEQEVVLLGTSLDKAVADDAGIAAPGGFTARHVAVSGGRVLWGGLQGVRPAGAPMVMQAARCAGSGLWRGEMWVWFDDGTMLRVNAAGASGAPVEWNGLLTFADCHAVRMRLKVWREGAGTTCLEVPLQADAFTGQAVWTSADGLPVVAPVCDDDAATGTLSPVLPEPRDLGDRVAVAAVDAPLVWRGTVDCGTALTCACSATSGSGSWDYGRSRFYMFTPRGVKLLTVNDKWQLSMGDIGDCTVGSGDAVTPGTGRTWALGMTRMVYVLDGSRVKPLCVVPEGYDRLGFDAVHGELLAACSSGAGRVLHLSVDTGRVVTSTSSLGPSGEWWSAGGTTLAATDMGLLNLCLRPAPGAGDGTVVGLTVHLSSLERPQRLRGVVWRVDGACIKGNLEVNRTFMGRDAAAMVRLTVDGAVHAPVRMNMYNRVMTGAYASVDGIVGGDTVIDVPVALF